LIWPNFKDYLYKVKIIQCRLSFLRFSPFSVSVLYTFLKFSLFRFYIYTVMGKGACNTSLPQLVIVCAFFSFICMFCRSLFVLLHFFFWPLCCLFFFEPQVIKFTNCLPVVVGSLRVLRLLPPLILVAMI
jgi:hypothetical protein